jgi:putative FmdB family regulatory protein
MVDGYAHPFVPVYEYRCDNGHAFEVIQRMTDDPVERCETCGAPVQRVFHPVAVHFKGSGFYNTDYGKRKRGAEAGASSDTGSSEKKDTGSSEKKDTGGAAKDSTKSSSPTSSSD